ncbi:1,4-alpha-glucan branching protein GlgB [Clostridium sp. AF18-27]|uniref:1,4-alpha-glucan branching protein GlgB n=1 Tax=Enterocloster lavalensis TaxID=460384 RepID=UPI000E557B00|nr:1,4-alpha-glucan branching protein GlgB [Enterocloster lavalensis]RHR54307.1 1,4-alpha-glucan branching protein GlgB [Clostridium sp. AF18-27]
MEQTLYDLMDWAGIEELVYSEGNNPHGLLGPHLTDSGLLVQALIPTAQAITVKITSTGRKYPMELADEAGFYAALIPRKSMAAYTLIVTYDNGSTEEIHDPYSYGPQYTDEDLKKFNAGIHYGIYEKMGAHPMTVKGVEGVYFSVWAPCAMRVSVVGDFNLWDGRRHPMRLLGDSGIFELFIPGLKPGQIYKYEIKTKAGLPMLKADPYANYAELRPDTASVVWDIGRYQWQDRDWMEKRAKDELFTGPVSIYEVHLGSWKRKELELDAEGKEIIGSEFYNYREIAGPLADYVKEMGYTHVELMPVMEHPLDASWGYQVTGYYAPTSRYGTPDDFMYFMDYMHRQGIGVILDWVPAHFPRDAHGMACFDGTCVYEHKDPRQGAHPHWGTLIYNYGRPGVSNFLIANALFWADKYHADGIRMDAVASMLYLDYGKNDGEWVPNIYGGNENLEAVEFLKHLSSVFKGRKDGAVLIAEESTAWPMVTGEPKKGGLGFDFKWNMGWMNDFTNYMRCDPLFRKNNYGELTFSMLYAYSENFILVFSHDEVVHGKGSMIGKMPGADLEQKAENLRAAYGFMMGHPGKKLLFMGQDFAQVREWNENASLDWELLETDTHRQIQDYMKALNELYRKYPAMYAMDYDPEGFQWINCSYQQESMIIFVRKTKKPEESLLFVCNFDNMAHEKFRVGVPFEGKYKEILSSNAAEFGGSGAPNPRVKTSRKLEWDDLENSIEINVAPMSVSIFTCTPEAAPKKARKAETGKTKKAGTRAEAGTAAGKAGKAAVKAADQAEGEKKPGAAGAAVKAAPKAAKTGKPAAAKTAQEPADGAVKVEKPATAEKPKKAAASKAKAGEPAAARPETVNAEGKLSADAGGQEKPAIEKVTKPDAAKEGQKRLTTAKEEQKKLTTAKEEQKKLSTAKEEQKKLSTAKEEQKKLSTAKEEQKKLSTAKEEQKKLSTAKEEQKKLSTAKEEQKKLSTAKEEQKKLSTAKEEQKKLSTAKEEPKKLSTAKRAQKKLATVKEELKKLAAPKEENDKDSQD